MKNKGFLSFIIFYIIVSALLLFYLDLANGPIYLLFVEISVLVSALMLRIVFKDKTKFIKSLAFLSIIVLNIPIIILAHPSVEAFKPVEKIVETDVLHLKNGDVIGTYNEDRSVEIYAGVPYAKAPVGNLRFKEPQEVEDWTGILNCTYFKPRAMQVDTAPVMSTLINMYAEGSWHPNYNMEPIQEMRGAAGQFLMGSMGSLLVALNIDCSDNRGLGILVWLLAIIVGLICGALWGAIPGIFKAFFDINEVVVCIMTNWIAANIVTWVFSTQSHLINIPEGKSAYLIKTGGLGTFTPTFGLDKLLPNSYIDGGIFIAILIAAFIFVIMSKTKFGFELKACGANKSAARYAGMNEKKNIVFAMAIAGALSAIGGSLYYLNSGIELQYGSVYANLPDYGFNGIPAALLANCDPIGVIFSATFLRYISASGSRLQLAGFNSYIAAVISSVIIYFSGFSRLFLELLSKKKKKDEVLVINDIDVGEKDKIPINDENKEGEK